ncbi:MAG: type VI secretion system baseplate subunit TssG [Pseudomonadota bacterium]
MAAGPRRGTDHLTHHARLAEAPGSYHIFLALRVLEAVHGDSPRLGESRRPRQDKVRLGQEPTLAYQRSTISEYEPGGDNGPGRLRNLFFGLFGPHGPLPPHLTEFARERERSFRDPTFAAFANMLTHRAMSLFYRAWAAGQPAVGFDRGTNELFERQVASISGYSGEELSSRDAMPDLAKRHFAGHLSRSVRNPSGLTSILSGFFGARVSLQEFVGSWLALEPDDRWSLGGPTGLGKATSIGSEVWSRSAKFRLRIGPLSLEEYRGLLPGSGGLARLAAIVRNYIGDALDWDVNLVLRADAVPAAVLGQDTRLGQTSWVGGRADGLDAEDLFLTSLDAARPAEETATGGQELSP